MEPSPDVSPSPYVSRKGVLRDAFRRYRRSLSAEDYARKSASIASRVGALPELQEATTAHLYWPMTAQREVDTRPLIGALTARNVDVVLPVVTNFDSEVPELEHRLYEGPESLSTNRWGIQEPQDTSTVALDALDAVVVPALGAGRNGHRIGHGSGYYDAFLAGLDAPRICCVYEACLMRHVPAEAHDVPMTAIVTESSLVTPVPVT